jgi:alginate O-acetyltransferase complex protein AlgI
MIFNSFAFAIFLPLVFAVHWGFHPRLPASRARFQNIVIVIASCIFYGWWDFRFLSLILLSTVIDFTVGLLLEAESRQERRRALIQLSVILNIAILAVFKYFNFFLDSFAEFVQAFGFDANLPTLRIILPLGISFYTFHNLSYTIDVYHRKLRATRDPLAFFAFVIFFPQLVAGPIARAAHLLPQFFEERVFVPNGAIEGFRQALWGMAKKVVIADNLAPHVNAIFRNYQSLDGLVLAWGSVLFTIQLYCDFSGYSDIAIGTGKLFGINLATNFRYPFFATNIADFWRRWHISLSTWFRDFVYVPLGGRVMSRLITARNVMVTFCISGLWHGAAWKFVVWGFLHGAYYLVWLLARPSRAAPATEPRSRLLPAPTELMAMVTTFALVTFAFVFFRAESLHHAYHYLLRGVTHPVEPIELRHGVALAYVFPLMALEWVQRQRVHGLDVQHLPVAIRWSLYLLTALAVLEFGNFREVQFIYFQF